MKCKDIMRRPVQSLGIGTSVEAAAMRMKEANIGFIPIVGANGIVRGVLTDRDIAIRVVAGGLSLSTPCESVMTTDLVWCVPDEELESAARTMGIQRKSRILVIDQDVPVGVLSLSDIAAVDIPMAALALHEVTARELLGASGHLRSRAPH